MAKGSNKSSSVTTVEPAPIASGEQIAEVFVGKWNRLVSTTNWEKGRIICEWREALLLEGAAVTEYSDEAWAQLVGGVTSQHVGRLRRVYQRFGAEFEQYPGLFWSHFQAGLDWDDAPMWLEGAIQNEWSVSQMRGKRWETLGTPLAEQRAEVATDYDNAPAEAASAAVAAPHEAASQEPGSEVPSTVKSKNVKSLVTDDADDDVPFDDTHAKEAKSKAPSKRTPLNVNVELLSDDLADAFEQFKLAIIAQRREGWHETSRETVIECLDALKDLVMAEA